MKWLSSAVLMSVVVATIACAPAVDEAGSVAEDASSVEADLQAINQVFVQIQETASAGDVEGFLALVCDDAELIRPHEPPVAGEDAHQWLRTFIEQFVIEPEYSDEEVVVAGDWAFHRYSYKVTATPRVGGESSAENGHGIHILQKQEDGSWKIYKDVWTAPSTPEES
jgi:ketosteroid isomerase-like protein